ncbi:N-alpha-acetyltransferase 25, NatB auxiliary subunit-like [Centruroides sculpturatus]|uniref:N-alpha-acetyltransferase 25, NatB auxiliary subunit-like n=1 Tax=Centruroides sculpturatus TaxID=218467 RepID=UPI000C6D3EB1|nr:N-alpha-acetyltransferase 25, NatB auxiliary subunit-like [Centruroides sculpturatus]
MLAWSYVEVLKALALIRLGRQEESLATLSEVHQEGPMDDATLQAMTICYRELHKPELIADAYETAVKKDPHNEELLSHLFMAYVRLEDYQKQKQTAMTLYRLKPKNPYYFWAVMSIVMQAKDSDEKLAKSTLLPLAERMTDKFIQEDKIEAEAEVQLYLMILEDQEKYKEALEVLEGPLKGKFCLFFISNISTHVPLSQSLKLIQLPFNNFEPPVDYTFDKVIEFISSLVKKEDEKPNTSRLLRGPYLAQMELLWMLLERKNELSNNIGTPFDLLMKYFEKFGNKPGCFLDIVHVIESHSMSDQQIDELLEKIRISLEVNEDGKLILPSDSRQMQRHLCYIQLKHWLGGHDQFLPHQRLHLAKDLLERYYHGLQFGKSLLSTEFQLSDNYCLLAAQLLLELWEKTNDERLLIHILLGLEMALKSSPSNFQLKLLLIKFYNIIGAAGESESLCESLDMKHIQHETLGYLITQPLLTAAHFTQSSNILGNTLRFFAGNHKDTIDYLISCYKFGSFTKIPEIVSFRERLNNSIHYANVAVERMILDFILETKCHKDTEKVITYMEIDPEKDKTAWEKLTDNRDMNVFRSWSRSHKKIVQELREKSFNEEINWLKIRNLIVRMMAAAFYLTKSLSSNHNDLTNGEKRGMSDILQELLTSLREHISNINVQKLINSHFPLQSPGPSRLPRYLQGGHASVILIMAEITLYLHTLIDGSNSGQINEKFEIQMKTGIAENFQKMIQRIKDISANEDGEFIQLSQSKYILEELVNFVETLSLCIVLVDISHTILKPSKSALMKKGKKKKENIIIGPETFQHFSEIINNIEQAIVQYQEILKNLDSSLLVSQLKSLSLTESELSIEDSQEIAQGVKDKIEKSYKVSLKELEDVVQNKLKYIQSLKW